MWATLYKLVFVRTHRRRFLSQFNPNRNNAAIWENVSLNFRHGYCQETCMGKIEEISPHWQYSNLLCEIFAIRVLQCLHSES